MEKKIKLTFKKATRTSLEFEYEPIDWEIPEDGKESSITWSNWGSGELTQHRLGTSQQILYSQRSCETKWKWKFKSRTKETTSEKEKDTQIIDDFLSGRKNTMIATLNAKRTSKICVRQYRQTRTREKKSDGTYTNWVVQDKHLNSTTYRDGEDKDMGTLSEDLDFYTRPDVFKWGTYSPQKDVSIYLVLTAAKWNELMNKAVQRYNWKKCQQDSIYTPKQTEQNQVRSGDFITAKVYNKGAELCEISTRVTAASPTNPGTLIKASLFTQLSKKVNEE